MGLLTGLVRAIRAARAEHAVKPGRRIAAQIVAGDRCGLFNEHRCLLARLARLDVARLQIAGALAAPTEQAIALSVAGIEVYLPLAGAVDIDVQGQRLEKELAQVERQMARSRELLSNESFLAKAPAHVVAREQSKLANLQTHAAKIRQRLERLKRT